MIQCVSFCSNLIELHIDFHLFLLQGFTRVGYHRVLTKRLLLSHMALLVKYVCVGGVYVYLTENHNLNVLIYSPPL